MHSFAYLSQNTFLKVPRAVLPSTAAAATTTTATTTKPSAATEQPQHCDGAGDGGDDAAQRAPFAVCGIAWDGCVTNRPGARFGPGGIRTASHMLCDGIHPLFNTTPDGKLWDYGDIALPNTSLVDMRAKLPPVVDALLERHHMVWLGGDHSITLPILRRYAAYCGRPLACIHFDAHCDTWKDHFGEESGHGTWVYEAIRDGIVQKECFFQLGIRSSGERDAREFVNDQGGIIFTARYLRGKDGLQGLEPVLRRIRERLAEHGNPLVYLTVDIDCLDPAFAPGTGTPEPGGLTSTQVLTCIEELAGDSDINFVGMDCVEVAPAYDHAELTTNVASTIVWTYLSAQVRKGKVAMMERAAAAK